MGTVPVSARDEARLAILERARVAAAELAYPDMLGERQDVRRRRMEKPPPTPEQRFWSHTAREGDCVVWVGALTINGYGQLKRAGESLYAHQVAWEYRHGKIPPGMFVVNICPQGKRHCLEHLALDIAKHRGPLKGPFCPRGHLKDYRAPGDPSVVRCRVCNIEAQRRYRARQKLAS